MCENVQCWIVLTVKSFRYQFIATEIVTFLKTDQICFFWKHDFYFKSGQGGKFAVESVLIDIIS